MPNKFNFTTGRMGRSPTPNSTNFNHPSNLSFKARQVQLGYENYPMYIVLREDVHKLLPQKWAEVYENFMDLYMMVISQHIGDPSTEAEYVQLCAFLVCLEDFADQVKMNDSLVVDQRDSILRLQAQEKQIALLEAENRDLRARITKPAIDEKRAEDVLRRYLLERELIEHHPPVPTEEEKRIQAFLREMSKISKGGL